MDHQLDLTSLMLFYEIVECGSLAAAGAKLEVAKSTVSRRLVRLEQQVGSSLLKRGTRKLTLTEIGASLHSRCKRIATEVEQASGQALEMQSNMMGTLRLSIPGDLGVSWLGGVMSDFSRQFPDILCRGAVQQGRLACPALHVSALLLSRDRIPRKTRVFLEFFAQRMSAPQRGRAEAVRSR
jgi:DNA-binding transcriptional LysR family regulator